MVLTKPHTAKNTLLEDKESAAAVAPSVFFPLRLARPARCHMSLKREEVGEKSWRAAGAGRCHLLSPSSLALKRSSLSGADTEVCTDEEQQKKNKVL